MKREAKRIAEGFEADERIAEKKAGQLPKAFGVLLETVTREAAAGSLTLAKSEEFIQRLHKLANPDYSVISLEDFWKEWITEQRRHVGASTASGYDQDLSLFSEVLGSKIMKAPLKSLTTEQINAAMDKARKIGKSKSSTNDKTTAITKTKRNGIRKAATINKALASLRRVMESAVVKNLASYNPAKQCRALSQEDSAQRAPFTVSEIRAMLDHRQTTDEWRGAITIAAHTGLRLSDVLSLNSKHVEGTRLVIMPSKTAKSKKVITVPLTPPCISWIGIRKRDFFPILKKQSTATTSMQFSAIMKKAKIPKGIEQAGGLKATRSFHSLRHTFASWLAEADVHADVRQKLTGHSSSKIHQRYTHHDEALDRAVSMLPVL
jgi:hypothetical protein